MRGSVIDKLGGASDPVDYGGDSQVYQTETEMPGHRSSLGDERGSEKTVCGVAFMQSKSEEYNQFYL